MTADEIKRIARLRNNGRSFTDIEKITGLKASTIRMYCTRHNIEPSKLKTEGTCQNCGKPLNQNKKGRVALFCSDTCRVKYWREQKISEGKGQIRICKACGKEFHSFAKSRKYCSHACYILDRFGGASDDVK